MNVLLVDDEEMLRRMMKIMLQKGGFTVFDAGDAGNALTLFARNAIDVLVVDVVMEPVSGIDLARLILQRRPQLPVLYITGFEMEDEVEAARKEHPRSALLKKPFGQRELVTAVERLLSTPSA